MTDWPTELERCVRCGSCRAVCPVFNISLQENETARGRLARLERSLQSGRFSRSDWEAFSRCLQCGRCVDVCKSAVPVPDLIRWAKRQCGGSSGISAMIAEEILPHPARLRKVAQNARRLLGWLGQATPRTSGLRLRFALPYLNRRRYIPCIPEKSFLEQVRDRPAQGTQRLALFTGCGPGLLFPEIGSAVDTVLAKLNLVAAVPNQPCCGLPAWGWGAESAARESVQSWLRAFPEKAYDTVLGVCASCTAHLQNDLSPLLAGTPQAAAAQSAAGQIEDFVVWLYRQEWRPDLKGIKVAVHVPCHLRRGVRGGDKITPLLIESRADVIDLPPDAASACCGLGGSFGVTNAQLSLAIGEKKIKAMLAPRPDVIVTSCTGCLIQLRELAERANASIPIQHPAVLLAG